MNVMELSREQIVELKGRFLDNLLWEKCRRGATYGEWASADTLISDLMVFRAYAGVDFVEEDFFC